uniref:Reverse transcriptase domain-containing protein n=1 Tax=Tanacetum cinerariifolium TaxID=118510 RepID=A0A6L2P1G4_TANCI|nr:hypothetical protein [Tanacetum cinerariifolium]
MSIQEMEDLKQQYLDEIQRLSNSEYRDEWANLSTHPSKRLNSFCYDDDEEEEDYTIAVIPSFPIKEPDNSLNQFEDFSESNDEFSSTDDDSFSIDNIDYIEASPPDSELVSSEVMVIVISEIKALKFNPTSSSDFMIKSSSTSLNSLLEETNTIDNSLPEFETFCFEVEEISSGSTTTHFDISLPKYKVFYNDHIKEISSGSPTAHSDSSLYEPFIFDLSINPSPPANRSDFYEFADELIHFISPPEYDCFLFKIEPNSGGFHQGCGRGYFSNKRIKSSTCFAHPSHPSTESEVPTF